MRKYFTVEDSTVRSGVSIQAVPQHLLFLFHLIKSVPKLSGRGALGVCKYLQLLLIFFFQVAFPQECYLIAELLPIGLFGLRIHNVFYGREASLEV